MYVAMAGQHQIWRYDIQAGTIANFSGTGYERNQNGAGPLTTSWAQPSGLSLSPDGNALYVADSESSTVRRLDLRSGGSQAIVGGDPLFSDNLFKWVFSFWQALCCVAVAGSVSLRGECRGVHCLHRMLLVLAIPRQVVRQFCRFGDKDGAGSDALLQHPLAVVTAPNGKGKACPAAQPHHCCICLAHALTCALLCLHI